MFKNIGITAINKIKILFFLFTFMGNILLLAINPKNWTRVVREVLARQILFSGIEALKFLILVAVMAGILVVVQTQFLVSQAGQKQLLGPILVCVIIRELAPLITNLIVIARSETSIATELANMRVNDEIDILEAIGIEPAIYLILPRVIGVSISVFCLTIIFIFTSLGSGFVVGHLLETGHVSLNVFMKDVLNAVQVSDIFNLLCKTFLIGFITTSICTIQGIKIKGVITEVPQAVFQTVEYSVGALFIVSALISVFTYI